MDKYKEFKAIIPEWVDQDNFELYSLRHTTEHILHQAVQELYPEIRRAMGPPTKEGFYFDFDPMSVKITEADFEKIENKMTEIVKRKLDMIRKDITEPEAKKLFKNNPYKKEWIKEYSQQGKSLTVYWTGSPDQKGSDVDLCKGPHLDNTSKVKYFKLLSIAGAYWRGDEKNKMLTRIYGTAFFTQKELDEYIYQLEESKKRDHRKLGRELDLFVFSDLVGGGLPLWTPKGTIFRNELDNFVWELRKQNGYEKVTIPHLTKRDLYETSGHWAKYGDDLFKIKTREGHEFALKPMNCPHHTQIFAYQQRSYKDMPQRYAETTMVYRDEQSGELSGLSRVRCITQDDAHVFCRKNQLKTEISTVWDIISQFYSTLGFKLKARLSLHDPDKMDNYLGTEAEWQTNEDYLRKIAKSKKVEYYEQKGEAAFYGPKIDFMSYDSIGREWQVATIQLDTNMPERFNLFCINEKGDQERIAMLHVAVMGSIERFSSIIIEHFAGAFPTWLSPQQVCIIPISDELNDYCNELETELKLNNIRVKTDNRTITMQSKIRDAEQNKIPYMLIIGKREKDASSVSLRYRGQKQNIVLPNSELISKILDNIKQRKLDIVL